MCIAQQIVKHPIAVQQNQAASPPEPAQANLILTGYSILIEFYDLAQHRARADSSALSMHLTTKARKLSRRVNRPVTAFP
jgi:hypothetical protein